MKVAQVMSSVVNTVNQNAVINHAAQIMWDHDCGCVPVVDDAGHVVAMLTDRDVCMAAYTQGRPLSEIPVSSAMSRNLISVKPHDTLAEAMKLMRKHRVRRLPVIDEKGTLLGLLSLNDLVRESERELNAKLRSITPEDVLLTLASIGVRHLPMKAETVKQTANVTFGTPTTTMVPSMPSMQPHVVNPSGI